ncbi:Methyltransferase domain-containing protein [Parapedobacter luteus]|uniref:Methyltransferase domain-containing protein n=1 Tax=Parapedobacter luteus TaxID=623280 RepID=A0A1T5DQX6_9SPHI|nr:methyltransferase domain-containing protein [Parapedobacter luteus]SKB74109.1 Methyltransferase domain-containing protein [Parapedobacter luteus]
MARNSIDRFSSRAQNYDRFRPNYPAELVGFLRDHIGLAATHTIADIAAGTGIFTEQIAVWGNPIYVVEPNSFMRRFARRRLAAFDNCVFVDGSAESTGLNAGSVDLIVAAQAFHWFDLRKTKIEFLRIGKDSTYIAIVWNTRNSESKFEAEYEALIHHYSVDYLQVSQRKMGPPDVLAFFAPEVPTYQEFVHTDRLTFEQLQGRTLSYSYMPDEKSPVIGEMLDALAGLFNAYQEGGEVRLSYKSRLYIGKLPTVDNTGALPKTFGA